MWNAVARQGARAIPLERVSSFREAIKEFTTAIRENNEQRYQPVPISGRCHAVDRRHNRCPAGNELRELTQRVKYIDLASLVQWEKYAMVRDERDPVGDRSSWSPS